MQTQKAREGAGKSCSEKKKPASSPSVSGAATNKCGKKKKINSNSTISASHPNSLISSSSLSTTPTPKLAERKLPEKRLAATARVAELESQVAHLEEDVNNTKHQLRSSESMRRQALFEAEEAKKSISLLSQKLEESQQQLMDLSNSEDDRLQQLRKLSQERDRAWQSELEAVQTQKSMDSAALASAMNEIKKLRLQLGRAAAAAESSAHDHDVRMQLSETLSLVENLRNELADTRESEAQAMEVVRNTEKQLEIANVTADTLRSELERLRDQIKDKPINSSNDDDDDGQQLRDEVSKLRSALEAAETRYQEEYIQSTLQIRSAYEQVERVKQESCQRQAAMEDELKVATSRIEQLMSKDSKVGEEMEKLRLELSEMKESLRDKETKLQMLSEENKALREEEEIRRAAAAAAVAAALADEEEKSNKTETQQQLEAANLELRRLKVQSEQWRKAAEVATSMLSTTTPTTTGKVAGSLDNSYYSSIRSSPSTEDMEDESPKKINIMMLKKIGVLWKKGQTTTTTTK